MRKSPGVKRTSQTVALALLELLVAACAAADGSSDLAQPGDHRGAITVGGIRRTFLLHVPPSYNGKKQTALVLAFHGRLGTGSAMARLTKFSDAADRYRFIVAYPDGIGRSWNSGSGAGQAEAEQVDDVGFASALLDLLSKRLKIDRRRVYATGFSNGGMFVQRLACAMADKLTAIATVAGPMPAQVDKECHPARPIPVLEIHGSADSFVPITGGNTSGGGDVLSVLATTAAWVERNHCVAQPKVTLVRGSVSCKTFSPCDGNADVVQCVVEGGGHTWPQGDERYQPAPLFGETNQDLQATGFIWTFFDGHAMKR